MHVFGRPSLASVGRSVASRSMATFAPGSVLRGSRWNYHIFTAIRGDVANNSSIYKAEIIPFDNISSVPRWAMIKAVSPTNRAATENLGREWRSYASLTSGDCFREMYDQIDNNTLAFEWMDTTLADVPYDPNNSHCLALLHVAAKAALTSCVVLERQGYVNTDFKPTNILLSNLDTSCLTAKVGDLGLVFRSGERIKVQPFAMRAPEVLVGRPCIEASQVWAVGAMFLSWMQPGILGAWGDPTNMLAEAWSMAKIKRLFPEWRIPEPGEVKGPVLQRAVEVAKRLSEEEGFMLQISHFGEEMAKVEMPLVVRDFLRLMLDVDPGERPAAEEVLASREFAAVERLASGTWSGG